MKNKKEPKVLFVSASGGHFEQLLMLKPLMEKYPSITVTEKTSINNKADYHMLQTGHKDKLFVIKMFLNLIKAIIIWVKEKPKFVVSTGTSIVFPFALLAKITGSKIIYIETFARVNDKTRTGAVMYKYADLFIIQWESLQEIYPNAVYGGSIY
ncbi:hypothetical protein BC6307_21390 [Sutcliffiella cohnii]|uniref:Polysaccharide biosynthesis protein n=1 Tax=Sutcliffiella cohnii TaxID=33932 RepID=A0A223KVW9_9BACI|nr:PssD/Cps14F family polysaccharide biosynthesis glycosyltransferase [Sutcliffiella cohnii]AST93635.1 hypothetical protein BC6307_21390 [Sutcliffiella cohnii]